MRIKPLLSSMLYAVGAPTRSPGRRWDNDRPPSYGGVGRQNGHARLTVARPSAGRADVASRAVARRARGPMVRRYTDPRQGQGYDQRTEIGRDP
jgi:hypothetical protein